MTTNSIIDLPADYTLVLQRILEDDGDDFTQLHETLDIRRARLSHIISALKQKGLVKIARADYGDIWIGLSSRGHKLVANIWPERRSFAAA